MILLLFILIVITPYLNLQAKDYNISSLAIKQGLSNNYVFDITQDKNGFIWFATEEGLNKFDGTSFTNFYNGAINSISGNELNCLHDDLQDSILWIGTQRSGLNAYNYLDNTFTVYKHDDNDSKSIATDDVTCIYPSSDGNLWVSFYWRGIDYFDKSKKAFIHYNTETIPSLVSNQVWSVIEDDDRNLYIGHVNDGLSILSLNDNTVKNFKHNPNDINSILGNIVYCIYKDSTGNIWVGTDKGLCLYNPLKEEFLNFTLKNPLLSKKVFDIKEFNNQIWIGLEFGGIAILDLSQKMFTNIDNMEFIYIQEGEISLNSSTVRCLYQDSYGNIWAGTWGGGVNFFQDSPMYFNTIQNSSDFNEKNITAKSVLSVCQDNKDRIWIGTDGGGINVFKEGKRVKVYRQENSLLSGNSVQAALCDSEGNLWFGVFNGGLMFYDSEKESFSQVFPHDYRNEDVRVIYEYKEDVWIGTSHGLFKFDFNTKKLLKHYDLPNNLIRTILKDDSDRLWIGTFGGGLYVYDNDMNLLYNFSTYKGFPSNTINHIIKSSKGNIWVATGEGAVCFDQNNIKKYSVYNHNKGLDNIHIHSMNEDDRHNIWFSTNKGISCHKQDIDSCYNYDIRDNIPFCNFITGATEKMSNNSIAFGSNNGLCYFYPNYVLQDRIAPNAVITRIEVLDAIHSNNDIYPFSLNKNLKLNYDENSFRIAFSVPDYSLSKQMEYSYKLEGFSDIWYNINNDNIVTFHNIPYGKYKFIIRTRLHNQDWSKETTSLNINIMPPLWLSLWAKLLYVLIVLLVISSFLYIYRRRLNVEYLYQIEKQSHVHEQELNQERLRFYTNITHELRTPLTLIIGPLEDLQQESGIPKKVQQKINVIYKSSVRLLNLINQLLEFRKTETQNKQLCISRNNITSLVNEIGLKYKELNRRKDLQINVNTGDDIVFLFDNEIVTIVLDNLLSNSIKYTEKGSIDISLFRCTEDNVGYVCVSVSDTGYGISSEAQKHIFDRYYQEGGAHQASGTGIGLALVKNLVDLHSAKITCNSALNVGSTFTLWLEENHTYDSRYLYKTVEVDDINEYSEEGIKDETNNKPEKPVLLVVEDNDDIIEYIAGSLQEQFEVLKAHNGNEGLKISLEVIPDVIISDIMMPEMNGIDMCRKLKKDMRTCHIPVILLTAKDTLHDKEEGYAVGADSYLTKPFSASLLISRINNIINSRKKIVEHIESHKSFVEKKAYIVEASNKLDNEFLSKLDKIIEDNISSEKIDVNYLADKMCMSSSTLYRKMKALTNLSTNEYIRKLRMKHAESLLLEGKYSISDVAFMVGINSSVYFRQCFKEEFGMTPSDYVKKLKQD